MNLTARKFAARSEVGIDDLPIWRFMLFSSYLQKNIQILRSDSWSTIKITSRNGFSPSISSVQILTILTILSFSKNRNDQTWQKKSFFMSDFESEGLILHTCKFSARSDARIDETPFWRFGSFLSYLQNISNFWARFRNLRWKLLIESN